MKQPVRLLAIALFALPAAALLASAGTGGTAARVRAAPVASVRVEPLASRVDWSDGPFSIRVELSDLDHHGVITYDDDRDTVPDREERSDGLGAYELVLHFDPNVLRVAEVRAGTFLSSSGRSSQCFQRIPEPGQYALGCVSTGSEPGAQGSGTLATITLQPLANGTSYLGLEAELGGLLGDDIAATVDGGIVAVFGAPEATPTPTPEAPPDSEDDQPAVEPPDSEDDQPAVEPPDDDLPDLPVLVEEGIGSGPRPAEGSDSVDAGSDAAGDGRMDEAFPFAGTGYEPPDTTARPLVLATALAVAGSALLLLGSRLATRAQRR